MARTPSESKSTSKKVLTKVAKQLADPKTPKKYRSGLASALAQGKGKIGK